MFCGAMTVNFGVGGFGLEEVYSGVGALCVQGDFVPELAIEMDALLRFFCLLFVLL